MWQKRLYPSPIFSHSCLTSWSHGGRQRSALLHLVASRSQHLCTLATSHGLQPIGGSGTLQARQLCQGLSWAVIFPPGISLTGLCSVLQSKSAGSSVFLVTSFSYLKADIFISPGLPSSMLNTCIFSENTSSGCPLTCHGLSKNDTARTGHSASHKLNSMNC